MPREKKSLSREEARRDYRVARYLQSRPRVLEAIDQMQKKEGPIYEKWKAGMKAYRDSLEKKGD